MTTDNKPNKPSEKPVDGRDKVIPNAVGSTTGDKSDTADNNASLSNKTEDNKPTVYKGMPVTSHTTTPSGKFMLAFQVDGDALPKVGDNVSLVWGKKTFNGVIYSIVNGKTVSLNQSKNKE